MHPTAVDIHRKIRAYHGELVGNLHHRYRSWEHCYGYFQQNASTGILEQRDHAALQLGFYLASWGMYRGSGFLLQHAYSVHLAVVDCLASPAFKPLWQPDIGSKAKHGALTPTILAAVEAVRNAYAPAGPATDTLVSKVMLGTFGCLPACDRLFSDGFTRKGFRYSTLNAQFVDSVLHFCRDNLRELQNEQIRIEQSSGITYPLMKLVDMYFWQVGYEANALSRG